MIDPTRPLPGASNIGKDSIYNIEFSEFDVRSMHRNSPIAFFGPIRSGKSKLITWILQLMRWPRVVAFLGGSDGPNWYRYFVPDIYIHEFSRKPWDSSILNRILSHQDMIFTLKEKFPDQYGDIDMELCLLFEDLSFDDLFRKDKDFARLVSNTRRLSIASIFSAQMYTSFGTKLRANIEFSYLFRVENKYELDFCWDFFNGGVFPSQHHFERAFLHTTSTKHQCMVIVKNAPDVSRRVFRLMAPRPPDEDAEGKKIKMKADYVVDQASIIFHHLFWKEDEILNPWVPELQRLFGVTPTSADPKPREVVESLGRHGTMVIRDLPPNLSLNKIQKPLSETQLPTSVPLPRPPPPGSVPALVPSSSFSSSQSPYSSASTSGSLSLPLPLPSNDWENDMFF